MTLRPIASQAEVRGEAPGGRLVAVGEPERRLLVVLLLAVEAVARLVRATDDLGSYPTITPQHPAAQLRTTLCQFSDHIL